MLSSSWRLRWWILSSTVSGRVRKYTEKHTTWHVMLSHNTQYSTSKLHQSATQGLHPVACKLHHYRQTEETCLSLGQDWGKENGRSPSLLRINLQRSAVFRTLNNSSGSWRHFSLNRHMGSHSVTRHSTQENTPRLNPSQTGRYSIYLPRHSIGHFTGGLHSQSLDCYWQEYWRDWRLSWPRWPVTYRDDLSVTD